MNNLWDKAIGDKTRKQYQTGLESFIKFTSMLGGQIIEQLPAVSEQVLIQYVTYCHSVLNLSYSTIKLYLCGIRYMYLRHGKSNPLEQHGKPLPGLKTILAGVKKDQSSRTKRVRLPIDVEMLANMCSVLDSGLFGPFTDAMLKAACTMAFFGFLRCGEFTVDCERKFDAENNLCITDLEIDDKLLRITLKKSKTDPFRRGITIPIYANDTLTCPVQAMKMYLSYRKVRSPYILPLFIDNDNNALSRTFFISKVKIMLDKLGFNSEHYNGHSFRIGAATTGSAVRLEDHLLKTLGRWSSNCYTTYIHTPAQVIQKAQIAMSSLVNQGK